MTEIQKSRIDAMTREELQNILIDSNLYDAKIIDYVKYKLRTLSESGSYNNYTANTSPVKPGFSSSYKSFFKKYATFDGRSSRSEFWFVYLANILVILMAYILLIPTFLFLIADSGDAISQSVEILVISAAAFIYQLICFIPNLALSVRRLHDIGKSGWDILLGLIPVVGAIILFVYTITDSEDSNNKYGRNPKVYPDKVHADKSSTVLVIFLVCIIASITISVCRTVSYISSNNAVLEDEIYDDYDYDDYTSNYSNDNEREYYKNDYEFFPSDREYITYSDLQYMSQEEIAFIRNEIYARHGYIFKTEPYKSYFNSLDWYIPNPNFNENMFSPLEKKNKDTIVKYETEMGWR